MALRPETGSTRGYLLPIRRNRSRRAVTTMASNGHELPVHSPSGDGYPATAAINEGVTVPVPRTVPGMNANVHQTEHDLLRDVLRRFLVAEVASSRCGSGCGRVQNHLADELGMSLPPLPEVAAPEATDVLLSGRRTEDPGAD